MKLKLQYPKEYAAWKAMRARCNAPCHANLNYQLQEIKVDPNWNSFQQFFCDMGPKPSSNHSLDRVDNTGDYTPNNCRWATKSTQSKNRGSFNRVYIYQNEAKVLKDWARHLGINYSTLYSRLSRGLSFEEAIQKDPYGLLIEYKGKAQTLKKWCEELNLKYTTIVNRKHDGWDIERALSTPTLNN